MKNRVITISREFGSGGRTIGKKVAEKLGIPCYDSEIIQEMAKETGFAPDYVKEAGEYVPDSFLSAAFSNRMFGPTNEDILWEHQYRVITELAEKGLSLSVSSTEPDNCVISPSERFKNSIKPCFKLPCVLASIYFIRNHRHKFIYVLT